MACDSLLTKVCFKLLADLLQVDCQNLLSTGLLQFVSTSRNKSANDNYIHFHVLILNDTAYFFLVHLHI